MKTKRKNKDLLGLTSEQHLIVKLESRASKLIDAGNREFALSLVKQWRTRGNLTDRQWHWVRTLLKRPAQTAPKKSHHFVYGIQAGDLVKIGFAADPVKRLRALQTSNPETLEVVYLEKHGTRLEAKNREAKLHRRLRSMAVRGEWFKADALQLIPEGQS